MRYLMIKGGHMNGIILLLMIFLLCGSGECTVFSVSPGQSLSAAIAQLKAGDTLNAQGGIYRVPSVPVTVMGQPDKWIVIRAVPGQIPVVRSTNPNANLFAIRGAAYVVMDGFEVDSVPPDVMPIRFEKNFGNAHDMLFQNWHIHDVSSVAIDAKGDPYNITFRHCHVHHTKDGTAEAFYIGDHTGIDHPHHWIIENCWIHHTGYLNSTQGDGIELKYGCYDMTVRNNVIYNTAYPSILYYGYNGDNSDGSKTCLIEGNVVWNSGEAIGAYADAVVRNNIVITSSMPVNSMLYTGHKAPENVEIYNNTFYDFDNVNLKNWDSTRHCIFANNAAYRTVSGACLSLGGTGTFYNNVATAPAAGFSVGSIAGDLSDPAANNFYPKAGSLLVNSGAGPCVARYDFNGTGRDASPDIGAYEFTAGANPGWTIQEGFKAGGPLDSAITSLAVPAVLPGRFVLVFFPNPAEKAAKIFLKTGRQASSPVELSIYDPLGRKLFCEKFSRFPSSFLLPESVAPGRYLLGLRGFELSREMFEIRPLMVR